MFISLYAFLLGFLLDCMIGDPQWRFHPIRIIGNLIAAAEKLFRRIFPDTDRGKLVAGFCMTVSVSILSFLIPFALLKITDRISPLATFFLEGIMCSFAISAKALSAEAVKIYRLIMDKKSEESKRALSMIVGRDVKDLDQEGVIKATVETVAENTTDGVIAPMLFMIIGGAPFAFFYKAVNTMDSMVGYKNEAYLYFGRVAAKFDDVLNYLPARIAANIMILASYFWNGADRKNARRIYRRDRYKHASPNSAHTEAVCAGSLNIQLAGDAYYSGVRVKKEYIGDPVGEIIPDKILMANKLMYTTAVISLIIFGFLKFEIINTLEILSRFS